MEQRNKCKRLFDTGRAWNSIPRRGYVSRVPYSIFFRELDFFEALRALFVGDAFGIGIVKRVMVASGKTAVALRGAVVRATEIPA